MYNTVFMKRKSSE